MSLTAETMTAALLALAVVLGWVRLALWQRTAPGAGWALWRIALLALLQPLTAAALLLTLFPPALSGDGHALVVATAGTAPAAARTTAGRLIALPGAPPIEGALALPDLGTARRRFPGTRRLVVLGEGLAPRDLDAARGLTIRFAPAAMPQGLVALAPPGPVPAGGAFTVTGQAMAPIGARAELVDPADRITDRQPVSDDGRFTLTGTTRAPGPVLFTLRLRRADGALIETAAVPVLATAPNKPRLLILAGAPGPEVKYLRRWASDAGFAVQAQIGAGGGVALGDPPIALSEPGLRGYDAAIVDPRAWAGLGSGRAALLAAVRGGLGLVVRADGEGESRAVWRELGLTLRGEGNQPVALPALPGDDKDAAALARTRHGLGSRDAPGGLMLDDPYLPEIGSLAGAWQGSEVVQVLPDSAGRPLAAWRPLGSGRIAALAAQDSYALVLTGQADLFASWWSDLLAAVARPAGASELIGGSFRVGERAVLCGAAGPAQVEAPDGSASAVTGDRSAGGCAAFWPLGPGWYRLRSSGTSRAFFVQPADALPALRARERTDATLRMASAGPATPATPGPARPQAISRPGSPWPWFGLWLAGCTLLWWLERRPQGRARTQHSA